MFAHDLRERIRRWTGITKCIGIGPTKTLTTLANKVANRGTGVVDLTEPAIRAAALRDFPVRDLWSVGHRTEAKLTERGITTAAGLRDSAYGGIMAMFGVTLARTVCELQGHACIELEESSPTGSRSSLAGRLGREWKITKRLRKQQPPLLKSPARSCASNGWWLAPS